MTAFCRVNRFLSRSVSEHRNPSPVFRQLPWRHPSSVGPAAVRQSSLLCQLKAPRDQPPRPTHEGRAASSLHERRLRGFPLLVQTPVTWNTRLPAQDFITGVCLVRRHFSALPPRDSAPGPPSLDELRRRTPLPPRRRYTNRGALLGEGLRGCSWAACCVGCCEEARLSG